MMLDIESLGTSTSAPDGELPLETLKELIGLVKRHVSLVVSELSRSQGLPHCDFRLDRSWLPYPDQHDITSCRFCDVDR